MKEELSTATTLFMVFGIIAIFTGIVDIFLFLNLNSQINLLGYELMISIVEDSYGLINLIAFESFLLLSSTVFLLIIGIFDLMTMQFIWKLKRITRVTGLIGIFLAIFYGLFRLVASFLTPLGSDIEFSYSIFIIAFNMLILLSFSKLWKYMKK